MDHIVTGDPTFFPALLAAVLIECEPELATLEDADAVRARSLPCVFSEGSQLTVSHAGILPKVSPLVRGPARRDRERRRGGLERDGARTSAWGACGVWSERTGRSEWGLWNGVVTTWGPNVNAAPSTHLSGCANAFLYLSTSIVLVQKGLCT